MSDQPDNLVLELLRAIRAEQAEMRAEQVEMRAEQAEMRAEQAEMRAEQAEMRAEQAEMSAKLGSMAQSMVSMRKDIGRLDDAVQGLRADVRMIAIAVDEHTNRLDKIEAHYNPL